MGPMMGSGPWNAGAVAWPFMLLPVLLMLVVLVIGLVVLLSSLDPARTERRRRSPEELLRNRYARGEVSHQHYQAALVDVLKDRYVRGEIGLEAYEAQLHRLLRDEHQVSGSASAERVVAIRQESYDSTKGEHDEPKDTPDFSRNESLQR